MLTHRMNRCGISDFYLLFYTDIIIFIWSFCVLVCQIHSLLEFLHCRKVQLYVFFYQSKYRILPFICSNLSKNILNENIITVWDMTLTFTSTWMSLYTVWKLQTCTNTDNFHVVPMAPVFLGIRPFVINRESCLCSFRCCMRVRSLDRGLLHAGLGALRSSCRGAPRASTRLTRGTTHSFFLLFNFFYCGSVSSLLWSVVWF